MCALCREQLDRHSATKHDRQIDIQTDKDFCKLKLLTCQNRESLYMVNTLLNLTERPSKSHRHFPNACKSIPAEEDTYYQLHSGNSDDRLHDT